MFGENHTGSGHHNQPIGQMEAIVPKKQSPNWFEQEGFMQSVRAGVGAIQDPVNIIQGAAEAQKALIDKTLSTVISLPKPQMMKYLRANPGKARLLGMAQALGLDA